LHHRFVVGGYVRKHVTLRISKGLRAAALAAGISQRVYSHTRVIFIAIYIALAEKIGTPLIKRRAWDCSNNRHGDRRRAASMSPMRGAPWDEPAVFLPELPLGDVDAVA
jgi:hypothetical protein